MRVRVAIALVIGCGVPAVKQPNVVVEKPACDTAYWYEAENAPQRAWLLAHAEAPVVVVDRRGDLVRVGTASHGAFVTQWVPVSALGRAVIEPVLASARPHGAEQPAVRILPGYPLPVNRDGWVALGLGDRFGVAVAGYVPASARGVIWTMGPAKKSEHVPWHWTATIRELPAPDGAIRATITRAADIYGTGTNAAFYVVTAKSPYVEVDGFIERPPPPPPQPRREYEFSEIELDGGEVPEEPPTPFPSGTCLYDRPHGSVVGMITGNQPVEYAAAGDWQRLRFTTPWGDATYFTDRRPQPPPPPSTKAPAEEWNEQWKW